MGEESLVKMSNWGKTGEKRVTSLHNSTPSNCKLLILLKPTGGLEPPRY